VACLIGDVAFLHDTNGLLGLAARDLDLLVVVVDNDGGGIFSFLPQAQVVGVERFEQLFGTPHGVDLAALCAAHGIAVELIDRPDRLASELARWADAGGTRVVIVPSDRAANARLHRDVNDAVAAAVRADLA
jgi:2-succinyl-5-enolpyruvyl-6-hydroxy-3-cyclohexene-1-carboxylate synthase